ncbi:MAG: 3-dehydroquinate synthase [Saprospiraceae bacterium]
MQILELDDYNIYVGDIWQQLNQLLAERNYPKIIVIVDDNTSECCLPIFKEKVENQDFTVIQITAGEVHKNIDTCQQIWQQMMDSGANRRSLTINIGGGVIGDMGGFCASTFKRGMDFIQMPTTLLSQVDASIGGKLGIDFQHIKNSVGVFNNPQTVMIAPEFLQTLSAREVRSGFAEMIKHALIADQPQWEQLRQITDLTQVDWADRLIPSLKIKQRIVEEDPFEAGIRKALNFGHTIGHSVESILLPRENHLLHGEAIAIGMITESYIAHKEADLSLSDLEQISDFILNIYDPVLLQTADYEAFIQMMRKDKKNEASEINFTLINPIGEALINRTCSVERIVESLDYYNQRVRMV